MEFIMRIRAPAKLVEEVKTKFFIKNGRSNLVICQANF